MKVAGWTESPLAPPPNVPAASALLLLLTIGRAEAPGGRDHGERGAAVHRPEVVLHVRVHVRVVGAEGRFSRASGMRRKSYQGDV